MIFRHNITGMLYLYLLGSYNVKLQEPEIVYIELETGRIYSRGEKDFHEKFSPTRRYPNDDINPEVDY